MLRRHASIILATATILAVSCKEGTGNTGGGGSGGGASDPGTALAVPVGTDPVYVDLDTPAIVTVNDAWELEFKGADVFTNGGVSGSGKGSAFGPMTADTMNESTVPSEVPFMTDDFTGGPFIDWFSYDNANHVLYVRFHVYGVRRGTELYKVQVLGFYGEQLGAPVAAVYSLRYAHVTATGSDPTVTLDMVDGTAGGTNPDPAAPSACLRLSTGTITNLTPAQAHASPDWDLCFRRAEISVNGDDGGPGGAQAVDLMSAETASETLAQIETRTLDTELPKFDAVDMAALTKPTLSWRGDGVRSAFTDKWITPGSNPLAPNPATWLVASSDGTQPFLVTFDSFEGASATTVGTIHLRTKAIKGSLP